MSEPLLLGQLLAQSCRSVPATGHLTFTDNLTGHKIHLRAPRLAASRRPGPQTLRLKPWVIRLGTDTVRLPKLAGIPADAATPDITGRCQLLSRQAHWYSSVQSNERSCKISRLGCLTRSSPSSDRTFYRHPADQAGPCSRVHSRYPGWTLIATLPVKALVRFEPNGSAIALEQPEGFRHGRH